MTATSALSRTHSAVGLVPPGVVLSALMQHSQELARGVSPRGSWAATVMRSMWPWTCREASSSSMTQILNAFHVTRPMRFERGQ